MRGTIQASFGITDTIRAPFTHAQSGIRRHYEQPINFERTPTDKTTMEQAQLSIRYPRTFDFPRNLTILTPYFVWVGHFLVI